MGIGFTIDTPIKLAHYGINSVISMGDDRLLERMREYYCDKFQFPFEPIKNNDEDARAKRVTEYLDVVNEIVSRKVNALKEQAITSGTDLQKYFELLPNTSFLKQQYNKLISSSSEEEKNKLANDLSQNIVPGDIEVNIMTKLDKANYKAGEALPQEMNDAHAALRGFAKSKVKAGVVLSAGLSPRLYSYISNFECFFPDENEQLEKKVILKVSDYRSALVQGKFLAKKGIWVSEYRLESGLNCGGHAFATEGVLMGPILEDFKNNRETLVEQVHKVLNESLESLGRKTLSKPLDLLITAQGGVGTNEEHNFLLDYYGLDSVGWGSPFLLVPEVINIDGDTLDLLAESGEDEYYLSDISPIGVPFNTVKGNTKDVEKEKNIDEGDPGSTCPSQFLKLYNTEFTEKPICVASKQYQRLKIEELKSKGLAPDDYQKAFDAITVKSCLCTGLVMTAYTEKDLLKRSDGEGIAVCPGPNLAYFSKESSLQEMVGHIYGEVDLKDEGYRPHMFIKELNMYVDYLKDMIASETSEITPKKHKQLISFAKNLNQGIEYYLELFEKNKNIEAINELNNYAKEVVSISEKIEGLTVA